MNNVIHVLHLEDDAADAELVQATLESAGMTYRITRVQTRDEFSESLRKGGYDVILADYALPMYDGMSALRLVKKLQLDVPLIFVSGTMGEDAAIEGLTEGATDYVLKQKLSRLVPSIKRALHEAENRRERKWAEKALRQAQEKYRHIFENAAEGIFQSTPDGRYLTVNPALAGMHGYASPEEMIGDTACIAQLVYVRSELHEEFKRKLDNEDKIKGFEAELRRKDGSTFWVSLSARTVRDTDGKVLYYEGTSVDITERRHMENVLRESEERFRTLTEKSLVGVYIIQDGLFRYVNPAFSEIFGYNTDEIVDRLGPGDFLIPEDRERVLDSIRRRISGEMEADHLEFHIRRKDGIIRNVEVYGSHAVHNGRPAVLGTLIDFTERKRVVEQMKESIERHRELADLLPQTVFEVNAEGYFTFANRRCIERFAYTQEDINQGLKIFKLLVPEDRDRAKAVSERVLKGETLEGIEFTALSKDGDTFPILTYFSPIKKGNNYTGFRGIVIDMTDRKKLEEQLFHAQKMESIGTLAGGIAHDFNNLLTTIVGSAHLSLMEKGLDDKIKERLHRILEASDSAAQLTRNLLTFGRKQIMKPTAVDLNSIVEKVEKMVLRTIGENIELNVIYKCTDLTTVADAGQIEQVLMNLIVNARDAMPEGGKLTIETDAVELDKGFAGQHDEGGMPGRYIRISARDTGTGMDKKTMERIFEPFFTTKEVGKGTGLGLSITYGIIKKHNGHVTVSSVPGKGTTVNVYLPLIHTVFQERKAAIGDILLEEGNEIILIAEDDALTRSTVRSILEKGGYAVVEAIDGEDAMNKFLQYKDDIGVVILDVVMPKKNAKEVYNEIKKVNPFQKILFMSGYAREFMDKSGIIDERLNFISKPILPNVLLAKVRQVLDAKERME